MKCVKFSDLKKKYYTYKTYIFLILRGCYIFLMILKHVCTFLSTITTYINIPPLLVIIKSKFKHNMSYRNIYYLPAWSILFQLKNF